MRRREPAHQADVITDSVFEHVEDGIILYVVYIRLVLIALSISGCVTYCCGRITESRHLTGTFGGKLPHLKVLVWLAG